MLSKNAPIPAVVNRISAAFATALTCGLLTLASSVHAQQAPDTENGRYTLSPVPEGFLRLDTRTGAVSTCTSKNGWTCRLVPDERAAFDNEIGRLQTENRQLKDELSRRDTASGKTDAPLPKGDLEKHAQASPDRKVELQLPPEHEKLLALLDRVWDRLIEMAVRLQKRLSDSSL